MMVGAFDTMSSDQWELITSVWQSVGRGLSWHPRLVGFFVRHTGKTTVGVMQMVDHMAARL